MAKDIINSVVEVKESDLKYLSNREEPAYLKADNTGRKIPRRPSLDDYDSMNY